MAKTEKGHGNGVHESLSQVNFNAIIVPLTDSSEQGGSWVEFESPDFIIFENFNKCLEKRPEY